MDRTTLNFIDWRGDMIAGNNVSKVTVRDLHLTRSTPGSMQGFVTEVRQGEILLEIPKGITFYSYYIFSPDRESVVREYYFQGFRHLLRFTMDTRLTLQGPTSGGSPTFRAPRW